MHLLTRMKNYLQENTDNDIEWQERDRPSVFMAPIFDPNAYRLIVSKEFAQFSLDYVHNDPEAMEEVKNFSDFNKPVWFELQSEEKDFPVGHDGLHVRQLGCTFLSRNVNNYKIVYEVDGQLHAERYDDRKEETLEEWREVAEAVYGEFVACLVTMRRLPKKVFQNETTEIGVPLFIKKDTFKEPVFFNYIHFRAGTKQTEKGLSGIDKHGVRWHWVRPHTMIPHGHSEPVPRKGHFRGDPKIGIVRKVKVGSI